MDGDEESADLTFMDEDIDRVLACGARAVDLALPLLSVCFVCMCGWERSFLLIVIFRGCHSEMAIAFNDKRESYISFSPGPP